MDLFDRPTLNITTELKTALSAAAKKSGLTREAIVDEMNRQADRYGVTLVSGNGARLTLALFEKWVNPEDKSRQMPIKALPVFCAVVRDLAPLSVLARPLGAQVIGAAEQKRLQWAAIKLNQRIENQALRVLETELGG